MYTEYFQNKGRFSDAVHNFIRSSILYLKNCSKVHEHVLGFSTDLNLNAISQVDGNQVVTFHSRVKLLQDFDVSLRVSEIQTAWLCGRE